MSEVLLTTPENCPQLLLERQLCFPLYAAARRMVNSYTPYLKPLGLTYTQYIVLTSSSLSPYVSRNFRNTE